MFGLEKAKIVFLSAVIGIILLTGCNKTEEKDKTTKTEKSAAPTATQTSLDGENKTEDGNMGKIPVSIENNCSNLSIKELKVSVSGENVWGEDILKGKVIEFGKKVNNLFVIMGEDEKRWDIMAINQDGKEVIFQELDISECESEKIHITLANDDDGNPLVIAQ